MKRLCVVAIGVFSAAAATGAVAQPKLNGARAQKVVSGESRVEKTDALALNNVYSDPYLTSYHGMKAAQFPPIQSRPPVEPQGGFSIRAGRDNPNEPMTGGLKFRF